MKMIKSSVLYEAPKFRVRCIFGNKWRLLSGGRLILIKERGKAKLITNEQPLTVRFENLFKSVMLRITLIQCCPRYNVQKYSKK